MTLLIIMKKISVVLRWVKFYPIRKGFSIRILSLNCLLTTYNG